MVQFVDDVKEVVEILRKRQDMRVIQGEITLLIERHQATVPITW